MLWVSMIANITKVIWQIEEEEVEEISLLSTWKFYLRGCLSRFLNKIQISNIYTIFEY